MRYFAGAAVLLAAAAAIAVTGGFRTDFTYLRVAVRWPTWLCVAAWILIVLGSRRSPVPPALERTAAAIRQYSVRHQTAIASVLAIGVIAAGLAFGAFVAAGADPYGYVSQSLLWARGNPVQFQTLLALQSPWPNAEWSFCPLGYKPSIVRGVIVPTYAPGLPLLMASLARPFGMRAAFLVVPLLGGLAVWSTYRLGVRVSRSHGCALLSALLAACSPVFLFQLMQPLSDVPATAWWLTSIVAALDGSYAGAIGSGLCASLAIVIRPNLVVLALPVAAYVIWHDEPAGRLRLPRLALFAAGLVPGTALTAAANHAFYGSPFASGYGLPSELFEWKNVVANLARYPTWLVTTHSPIVFIGLAAAVVVGLARGIAGDERRRLFRHAVLGAIFFATLFAAYVSYIPFDHWTYLRFLLPGIPILLVLAVATVNSVARAISPPAGQLALSFIALVLPLYYVSFAVHGDAFALKRLFVDRYVVAASAIAARTSATAVVGSVLQSGSLRLYADRSTVRYDVIPPEWLDRVVTFLNRTGRTYVALESTEQIEFARRFNGAAIAGGGQVVDPLGLVRLYGPLHPE